MKILSKYGLAHSDDKKFNAVIGISVGGRMFSKKRIRELLLFAIPKFENILVLIVDSIKKYNWIAFDGIDEKEASKKAEKEGKEYRKAVMNVIENLRRGNHDVSKIEIRNYNEIAGNIGEYNKIYQTLKEFYLKNILFKNDCLEMTQKYIDSKSTNEYSIEQKEIAVEFLLNELTMFLLLGISTKESYCIDIYPGKFPVIENILNGKYSGMKEKLPQEILYGHIEIDFND